MANQGNNLDTWRWSCGSGCSTESKERIGDKIQRKHEQIEIGEFLHLWNRTLSRAPLVNLTHILNVATVCQALARITSPEEQAMVEASET